MCFYFLHYFSIININIILSSIYKSSHFDHTWKVAFRFPFKKNCRSFAYFDQSMDHIFNYKTELFYIHLKYIRKMFHALSFCQCVNCYCISKIVNPIWMNNETICLSIEFLKLNTQHWFDIDLWLLNDF